MQQKGNKIENFSIKDAERLISSIIAITGETEEAICKALSYNEGYISQLRSRENRTGDPQVSAKFLNQLSGYHEMRLQNANGEKSNSTPVINPASLYERLLEEKERGRIRAEKQADEYLQIIKDNLTALLLSSTKNQEYLVKIYDEQTSDDLVMMDNQDEVAKNPKGTSSEKSGRYQVKLATARKEAQQSSGKGRRLKAGK